LMSRIPFDLLKTPTFSNMRPRKGLAGRRQEPPESDTTEMRRQRYEKEQVRPSAGGILRAPKTRAARSSANTTPVLPTATSITGQANKPMSDAMSTAAEALIQPTVPHSGRSGPLPLAGLAKNLANGPWLISRIERHLQERLCLAGLPPSPGPPGTGWRGGSIVLLTHPSASIGSTKPPSLVHYRSVGSVFPVPIINMRCIHIQVSTR
jgi:hypothetical protein